MLYESRSVRRLHRKKSDSLLIRKTGIISLCVLFAVAVVFNWPVISEALSGFSWFLGDQVEAAVSLPENSLPARKGDSDTASDGTLDVLSQIYASAELAAPKPTTPTEVPVSAAVGEEYFADALFIGDSLTVGMQHYQIIPGASYIASTGINLEAIRKESLVAASDGSMGTMMQAIAKQKEPGKVYVMMGTNGINWQSFESMIANYTRLLDHIMDCYPRAIIYVQSIPPASAAVITEQPGFAVAHVREYNEGLKALATEKGVYFIDIHAALADEQGHLSESATNLDGIHFSADSYHKWYEYLKTHTVKN